MSAARTISTGTSGGVVERLHFLEYRQFDALNHELRNSVAATNLDRCVRVEIDQTHLELASITCIHGARRIHDGQTRFCGKSGTRMDESDSADRQGNRNTRTNEGTAAGLDSDIAGGAQIHTGITGMCTLRNRQVWVQSLQGDGEMIAHVGQDYSAQTGERTTGRGAPRGPLRETDYP